MDISFIILLGVLFMPIITPYYAFKSNLTRPFACIALLPTILVWIFIVIKLHEWIVSTLITLYIYGAVCGLILFLYRDEIRVETEKEETENKERKETEKIERLKQQLRDVGIDPDKPTTLDVCLYSYNNKVLSCNYIDNDVNDIAIEIENTALNKKQTLQAEISSQVEIIVEEVFRLWARQESDPVYICTLQNYAKRPPKSYRIAQFVGVKYRSDDAYMRYKDLIDGEKVLLVKEPSNPYDKYAIKVLSQDGYHIGYLAKEYAKKFRNLLGDVAYGWHYHYDEKYDFYNTIRIYKNYIEYEEERDTYKYPYT